jgi:FdhD protein
MYVLSEEATISSPVHTLGDGQPAGDRLDCVAVEAPLEIRLGGKPATVLMRTPGHDEELVRGFLYSEGIIVRAEDIARLGRPARRCRGQRGNVISVRLARSAKTDALDRPFYSSSACGVCGKKSLASLEVRGSVADDRLQVKQSLLARLPEQLKNAQPAFARTGGVHAAALFTAAGELVQIREDVGRHNALDKLIGWALAQGRIPLADYLLLVSGRVSYEIIQKAIVAGLPFIAAVGAPSSLAIDLAGRFKLTLVGFLRPETMNVYAHPARILR